MNFIKKYIKIKSHLKKEKSLDMPRIKIIKPK
jgi:hypothetical protein